MIPTKHFFSKVKMITVFAGLLLVISAISRSCIGKDSNQAVGKMGEINMNERINSMQHQRKLGDVLALYANDNKGKYPEKLEEFRSYRGIDLDWILKNVCYIGAKLTMESPPDKPVAFDKTMLLKADGTVVLFNDKHVEFIRSDKLAELGIRPSECISDNKQKEVDKKQEKENRQIILKVVGPDNKVLGGTKVYQYCSIQDGNQRGKEYISDENGVINLTEETIFKYEWQRKGVVLYGLYEDKLAGFVDVKTGDLGKNLEKKLTPACKVHGKITSTELSNLGQEVKWTNVYVYREKEQPLSYSSQKGEFEFLLPEGAYELVAYGTRTYNKYENIELAAGQGELEINLDLPADRLAFLIGKEAPELQQIEGWMNSKPIKLANIRGKVVLLDFWGTWCGPCVAEIPELIDLYEKYHDEGLVIIAIHDDSMNSLKDLEKEIAKLTKNQWDGKKIPFAVALDGGGSCKIEGTQRSARGATTAAYGIQSWPTIILIDKQGKIVKEYSRGGNDTALLEKLLAAK